MTAPLPTRDRPFDGRVPAPEFVSVETTMFCNLRCPMCIQFQNGTTVTGPHMTVDVFETVAKQLFPYVTRFQPSVSGEPLMSRGLDRMLELAAEYGVRAEYYTNATLLDERLLARILPTLGRLCVSFDGASKEVFETIRERADFDKVMSNLRHVVEVLAALPEVERPPVGLVCTLMERNVRELPALVDLAAELGMDFLGVSHVFPVTREMQQQSLSRHQDLAAGWIEEALRRATATGLPMWVQPLDQVVDSMATAEDLPLHYQREMADQDGVVEALRGRAVHQDRQRPWPTAPPAGSRREEVRRRREERTGDSPLLPVVNDPAPAPRGESIWTCDFLWQKVYVNREGTVHPCCVPGTPVVGNLQSQSFEEIWDNEVYRAMRLGLVHREPAPCCRGCQHIRKVEDPDEIGRLLQGRPPARHSPGALPRVLRPIRSAAPPGDAIPACSSAPPELTWEAVDGAEDYEVELSLDGFHNVALSTAWHDLAVAEPRFRLPEWAWQQAPFDLPVQWRALAVLQDHRQVVGGGVLQRQRAED